MTSIQGATHTGYSLVVSPEVSTTAASPQHAVFTKKPVDELIKDIVQILNSKDGSFTNNKTPTYTYPKLPGISLQNSSSQSQALILRQASAGMTAHFILAGSCTSSSTVNLFYLKSLPEKSAQNERICSLFLRTLGFETPNIHILSDNEATHSSQTLHEALMQYEDLKLKKYLPKSKIVVMNQLEGIPFSELFKKIKSGELKLASESYHKMGQEIAKTAVHDLLIGNSDRFVRFCLSARDGYLSACATAPNLGNVLADISYDGSSQFLKKIGLIDNSTDQSLSLGHYHNINIEEAKQLKNMFKHLLTNRNLLISHLRTGLENKYYKNLNYPTKEEQENVNIIMKAIEQGIKTAIETVSKINIEALRIVLTENGLEDDKYYVTFMDVIESNIKSAQELS
jgi:hypothetical protein